MKAFGPRQPPWIVGMVHLEPLPGTPFYVPDSFDRIRQQACADALALQEGGADGCLIQTVDRVYDAGDTCDPARLSAISLVVSQIRSACGPDFLVGVQIMKNALCASLAVAKITGAQFIRAAAWVGATASPFGILRADPARVQAYRRSIDATDIVVVADIHTQHFRWHDGDMPLQRVAHWAVEAGADALCLGEASIAETHVLAQHAREGAPHTPIILPGYTSIATAPDFLAQVSGVFVGGCLKAPSSGRVDLQRVQRYVVAARGPGTGFGGEAGSRDGSRAGSTSA